MAGDACRGCGQAALRWKRQIIGDRTNLGVSICGDNAPLAFRPEGGIARERFGSDVELAFDVEVIAKPQPAERRLAHPREFSSRRESTLWGRAGRQQCAASRQGDTDCRQGAARVTSASSLPGHARILEPAFDGCPNQPASAGSEASRSPTTPSKGSRACHNAAKESVPHPRVGPSGESAEAIQRPFTSRSRTSTQNASHWRRYCSTAASCSTPNLTERPFAGYWCPPSPNWCRWSPGSPRECRYHAPGPQQKTGRTRAGSPAFCPGVACIACARVGLRSGSRTRSRSCPSLRLGERAAASIPPGRAAARFVPSCRPVWAPPGASLGCNAHASAIRSAPGAAP